MPIDTLKLFTEYGGYAGLLMGLIVLGLSTAVLLLWKQNGLLIRRLSESQNRRVDDAKDVVKELIAQSNDMNKALHELSSAFTALRDVVIAQR